MLPYLFADGIDGVTHLDSTTDSQGAGACAERIHAGQPISLRNNEATLAIRDDFAGHASKLAGDRHAVGGHRLQQRVGHPLGFGKTEKRERRLVTRLDLVSSYGTGEDDLRSALGRDQRQAVSKVLLAALVEVGHLTIRSDDVELSAIELSILVHEVPDDQIGSFSPAHQTDRAEYRLRLHASRRARADTVR